MMRNVPVTERVPRMTGRHQHERSDENCRQSGFTLVELIVVLVILAILAAIMVPALSGWIRTAREKRYIIEARSCVQAADARGFELYGAGTLNTVNFLNNEKAEILTLAGVPAGSDILDGSLAFTGGVADGKPPIEKLTYVSADNVRVKYERNGNPVYEIGTTTTAPGAPSYAVDWDNKIQGALGSSALPNINVNTGTLTDYVKSINGGTLPSLTAAEKGMLSSNLPAGIKEYAGIDALKWKPVQVTAVDNIKGGTKQNGYLLIASASGINAALVYYNNSYYMCLNKVGSSVKADYNSVNSTFDLEVLTNAQSLSALDVSTVTGKTWVRCD